jgi:hypothetical protein
MSGEIKKKVGVDTAKCPRKIEHGDENLSLIIKYQGGEGGWVFKIFGVRNMPKKMNS